VRLIRREFQINSVALLGHGVDDSGCRKQPQQGCLKANVVASWGRRAAAAGLERMLLVSCVIMRQQCSTSCMGLLTGGGASGPLRLCDSSAVSGKLQASSLDCSRVCSSSSVAMP
jgi:hypothetical protein